MKNFKHIIIATIILAGCSLVASAQMSTSPYSKLGYGLLSDNATGIQRSMGGVGYAMQNGRQINVMNPASYWGVDSLTFLLDMGIDVTNSWSKENGKHGYNLGGGLDYITMQFRLAKNLGGAIGVVPFSSVGYSFGGDIDNGTDRRIGTGGLSELFAGVGYQPFKGLSIGANFSYLWGSFTRSVVNSYNDAYINTLSKSYSADVRSYKLDAGLQYQLKVSKDDQLTIGATYTMGHKLGCDPECRVISVNPQTSVSDTTKYVLSNGFELPTMIGAGFSLNHANRLRVGADYTLQKWGSVSFPEYSVVNDEPQYALQSDYFKDRHKVTVGADYCNNEQSRRFIDRVHFRAGASYATPYLKINGQDGPKELSVSAGFGIPIINRWYERERSRGNISMLNISAQWVQRSAASLIKENTFRINVGVTFNERWFAKWKVE